MAMPPVISGTEPASRQSPLERWAVPLLVGLSLVFSLVPDSFTMGSTGPEATHTIAQGSGLRQLEFGTIFLVAAWLAWRNSAISLRTLRAINPFLLLLLVESIASTMWSPYPVLTLKRVVLFVGLMLTGLAVAPPTSPPRQQLQVVMRTFTLLLVISCFVSLAIPSVGVDRDLGNAWRGILWQKNVLGSIAGFAALLWAREWLMTPSGRRASTIAILFSLFMLVMAKSATAVVVTGVGAMVYVATRRRMLGGRHAGQIVVLTIALAALYGVLVFFIATGRLPDRADIIEPVTSLFNKSSDLTGRSGIWRMVEIAIAQHPVWGIGYGAFWVGEGGPSQYIARAFGWMPANGHNGYLDLQNELGLVGLWLFAAALAWHAISIARLFRIDREDAAMHLGICVAILVSNMSESQLLRDVSFQNILFIFSSLAISGRLAAHRMALADAQADADPPSSRTTRRQGVRARMLQGPPA